MTKRLQTIVLASLSLDLQEISEDKDYETYKNHVGFGDALNGMKKKAATSVILKNF